VNPESGDPVTGREALLLVHIPENLLKGEVKIALDLTETYWQHH